jgi:hypothetical protein
MNRRLGRGVDARFVETGQLFRSLLDSIGVNVLVEQMRRLAVFLSGRRIAGEPSAEVTRTSDRPSGTLRFILMVPRGRRKRKRPALSRKTTRQEAPESIAEPRLILLEGTPRSRRLHIGSFAELILQHPPK